MIEIIQFYMDCMSKAFGAESPFTWLDKAQSESERRNLILLIHLTLAMELILARCLVYTGRFVDAIHELEGAFYIMTMLHDGPNVVTPQLCLSCKSAVAFAARHEPEVKDTQRPTCHLSGLCGFTMAVVLQLHHELIRDYDSWIYGLPRQA